MDQVCDPHTNWQRRTADVSGYHPSFRTFSLKRMDHTDMKSKDFSSVNKTHTYGRVSFSHPLSLLLLVSPEGFFSVVVEQKLGEKKKLSDPEGSRADRKKRASTSAIA